MDVFFANTRVRLKDSDLLGEGGEARVFRWKDKAVKIFHPIDAANVAEVKPLYQVAAEIYQLQGNLPEAIATYEQLRGLDPNDTTTLQVLLNFYVQQADDAKVVEIAQALAALDPTNFIHPWQAAQALVRLNRLQEALSYAQQALPLASPEQQPAVDALIQQITGG